MEAETTRSMEPQHLDELEMPSKSKAAVNFNQGMRRLAVFAGVLGAVAGGFHAHKDLRNVPAERYQHKVFEKLAASETVKRSREPLISAIAQGHSFDWPLASELIPPNYNAIAKEYGGTVDPGPVKPATSAPPPATLPPDFNGWDKPTQAQPSNGIRTIYWKPDLSVDYFEMQDGGYVNSEPSPSAWLYLLWVAFPALGFIIVWGAIRGIWWVGAGFLQTPK